MSSSRARRLGLVLAAVWLLVPLAAAAKDVCIQDNDVGTFVFQKVKKFKTGRAVALSGIYIRSGTETFPVQGMAVLRPNGNVEAAVIVHDMSFGTFNGRNFSASMQVTTGLEGTGGFDADGDNQADNTSYAWSAVDCADVAIP